MKGLQPWLAAFLMLLGVGLVLLVGPLLDLSALDEPGLLETRLARAAKHALVARSARSSVPPEPPADPVSRANGRMQFWARCASCHGQDGRTPTELGRWMYPRALDLGSPASQQWSDRELFWIIKNGIRLTGMPGFAHVHSNEEIWHLVHYVRSLKEIAPVSQSRGQATDAVDASDRAKKTAERSRGRGFGPGVGWRFEDSGIVLDPNIIEPGDGPRFRVVGVHHDGDGRDRVGAATESRSKVRKHVSSFVDPLSAPLIPALEYDRCNVGCVGVGERASHWLVRGPHVAERRRRSAERVGPEGHEKSGGVVVAALCFLPLVPTEAHCDPPTPGELQDFRTLDVEPPPERGRRAGARAS